MVVFLYKYIYMKSFKQYLNIEAVEPMVDFEDPSFNATYNASMKDKNRWPPFPKAKYDTRRLLFGPSAAPKIVILHI